MNANHEEQEPKQANEGGKQDSGSSFEVDENGRPTQAQRLKDGRRGLLHAIYVEYYVSSRSNELRLEVLKNLYMNEVLDFREKAPTVGVLIKRSPGQWELIMPGNIDSVKIERQNNYFDI